MIASSVCRAIILAGAALCATSCASWAAGGCKRDNPKNVATTPDSFVVSFATSRGNVDVMARKNWSPIGAARLYDLVQSHYYDEARFYRTVNNFVAQFGLSGDAKTNADWRDRCISDEPVQHSNTRGTIAYARGDSNTRSVQLYINLRDNPKLDTLSGFGFPPVAEVVNGMDVVDSLYNGYGEAAPRSGPQYGREGPSQDSIRLQGNAYLARGWPKLDYIKTARVVKEWRR
jgi:peptidyl-prolyl cis-trans isomerase A (cyclophilin A)